MKVAGIVTRVMHQFGLEFATRVLERRVTPLEQVNGAAIGMRPGNSGIHGQRFAILLYGKVELAALLISAADEHVQFSRGSKRSEHLVKEIGCIRDLIELEIGERQTVGDIDLGVLRPCSLKLIGCSGIV